MTEALFPPAAAAARHDLVVVDTAPTGHTLRLLALPGLALEWVRALLTTLLKYRQVLGLGALAKDVVELSRGLRQLQALLTDPRQARVVVVTRPAALPRLETLRLLRRLESLGLTVSALVVNALAPPGVEGGARPDRGARSAASCHATPATAGAASPRTARRAAAARGLGAPRLGADLDPGRLVTRARRQASPQPRRRTAPRPSATYVYCVTRSARRPALGKVPAGLPDTGRPRALAVGQGLWLIVADAPLPRYGETELARIVRDLDAVSRCAVAHSAVVAHCARRAPVLPLRLLTLFSSDERALARVRGRRARHHAAARPRGGPGGVGRPGAARAPEAGPRPGARGRPRGRRRPPVSALAPASSSSVAGRARRRAVSPRGAKAAAARALSRARRACRRGPPAPARVGGRPARADPRRGLPRARGARRAASGRPCGPRRAQAAGQRPPVRLTGPWPPYSFVAGRL